MTILVTGFDRGSDAVNASQALVDSLREVLPPELQPRRSDLHFAILPLSTREVWDALASHIASCQPRYCVFTGQARGRGRVELERLASNLKNFGSPDAEGLQPQGEKIDPTGPQTCRSTLPGQKDMVALLNASGIPAALSSCAGNHLCNQILYQSLFWAKQYAPELCCGFLHIPPLPEQTLSQWPESPSMPLETTRRALAQVLLYLQQQQSGKAL
ncbi:MAG: hypothetical protein EP334_00385 [Gammaproteobacteria bacterium]|nr:MAG: hypothetical protein EP334_00385 [Gammaproteobacteria bacterium]